MKTKKPNVLIELLKMMGATVIAWFFWVLIFAGITPGEEIEAKYNIVIVILAIATGVLALLILQYNECHRAAQQARRALSDIQAQEERATRLLDKANRVAKKYMKFEKDFYVDVEHERRRGKQREIHIRNASQFQLSLESYPELQSNENIQELLRQIQNCENALMGQKMRYNSCVEEYNVRIYTFPVSMLRRALHFEEMKFYKSLEEEAMISDEALGI